MKVGWIQDNPGYLGGAELTAAEFRTAAPVEVVYCAPGEVVPGFDRYVLHNCVHYSMDDLAQMGDAPFTKYLHDVYPHSNDPAAKPYVLANARLIFCSPLQRERMGLQGECIPPAMDLSRFKAPRQSRKRREGTCSLAQWRNPGKGGQYVEDYAREHGEVHAYGPGPFEPRGQGIKYHGPVENAKVPQLLWNYETFVFLPWEIEPFCRTVVEAHAAGCEVVTNSLIGARHYLENDPDALDTAADRFWEAVLA